MTRGAAGIGRGGGVDDRREDLKMINVVIKNYYVTVTNVFNLGLCVL